MGKTIHHHCHNHAYNHHNTKINIKDTSSIKSTYKPLHLYIRYQEDNLLLMNVKSNLGWDYNVPPNLRISEPNISSSIHPRCHIPSMNVGLKPKEPTRVS